jgi:hypothetical protein
VWKDWLAIIERIAWQVPSVNPSTSIQPGKIDIDRFIEEHLRTRSRFANDAIYAGFTVVDAVGWILRRRETAIKAVIVEHPG